MNDNIVFSSTGYECNLCGGKEATESGSDAFRKGDAHLAARHVLQWRPTESNPYREIQVADGRPFIEIWRFGA